MDIEHQINELKSENAELKRNMIRIESTETKISNDEDQRKKVPIGNVETGNRIKERICKFFQNGKCKKGNSCDFTHKKICKFYVEGRCNKDRCEFVHNKINLCRMNSQKKHCKYGDRCKFIHVFENTSSEDHGKSQRNEFNNKANKNEENNRRTNIATNKETKEPNTNNSTNQECNQKNENRLHFLERELQEIKRMIEKTYHYNQIPMNQTQQPAFQNMMPYQYQVQEIHQGNPMNY